MADLIDRDAFIAYLKTARASAHLNELSDCDTEEAKRCINDEMFYSTKSFIDVLKYRPAVDAVPVVHGHWIKHDYAEESEGLLIPNYECSVCHSWLRDYRDYCGDCGSKMDEKDGDSDG